MGIGTVDAATFRAVLGQWPSGVTVVTTVVDDRWHGMTASSFSSVSLDPPLVSVCLAKAVWTHGLVEQSGRFAVNILAKDQAHVGMLFAGQRPEVTDRFQGLSVATAETGCPVLTEALGWLDCRVRHAYDGGDHTIFVGEVLAAATPRLTAPLLFHSRAWGQFADLLPDEAQAEDTGIVTALLAEGVDPERVAEVVGTLRDAGVRVRIADLTAGPPDARAFAASGPVRVDPATAAVRVVAADQVGLAVGLGAGHVEVDVRSGADVERAAAVVAAARTSGLGVTVSVDGTFGSGDPVADELLAVIDACVALTPDSLALTDSADRATPLTVRQVLQEVVTRTKPVPLTLALSDPAGLGLANALTALKSGVRRFQATLGGLDGRVALEDVAHLVASLEIASPVDLSGLDRPVQVLQQTGHRSAAHVHDSPRTPTPGGQR